MGLGLERSTIEHDLSSELRAAASALPQEQAQELARAVAAIIEKNNREIERNLGKKFADIERIIGR
jgi:hypothetical protein